MKQNKELGASELMNIIADQLRKLSSMELSDRNIGKCIAQSKEIGNLAGKAIALSHYELERKRIGSGSTSLLPEDADTPHTDAGRVKSLGS